MSTHDYDATYAQRQLIRSRNPLRRLVKGFYLRDLCREVRGPAIDFGCGAGQLLARLPAGSLGLEVNATLVDTLRSRGLNVQLYEPELDQLRFSDLPSGQFETFIMSHVLEHFDHAAVRLRQILYACGRLNISRVIVVVPGAKGYAFDSTHRSFVTAAYLQRHRLLESEGYAVSTMRYYPINLEVVGKYFTFHELKIIYDKQQIH
ncbi:MAG: methyltransferase domain-containing protein [Thiobacillus sp.]|nr:methyltransferase domain-containing protein [Thiobacillus sp.]